MKKKSVFSKDRDYVISDGPCIIPLPKDNGMFYATIISISCVALSITILVAAFYGGTLHIDFPRNGLNSDTYISNSFDNSSHKADRGASQTHQSDLVRANEIKQKVTREILQKSGNNSLEAEVKVLFSDKVGMYVVSYKNAAFLYSPTGDTLFPVGTAMSLRNGVGLLLENKNHEGRKQKQSDNESQVISISVDDFHKIYGVVKPYSLSFTPTQPSHKKIIATFDTQCIHCKKFYSMIPDLVKLGIEVNLISLPLQNDKSKAESNEAFCSPDWKPKLDAIMGFGSLLNMEYATGCEKATKSVGASKRIMANLNVGLATPYFLFSDGTTGGTSALQSFISK